MAASQTLELLVYPPYFQVDQNGNPLFTSCDTLKLHAIDIT